MMKSTDAIRTCPMCEEGQLEPRTHTVMIRSNDRPLAVEGMEYCACPVCGADPVLVDQIARNERRVADAKRAEMGMLTSDEIRSVRKMLGVTQKQASELLGGGANGFSKYERGAVLQSVAMDTLLKLLALRPDLVGLVGRLKGRSLEECYLQYDWAEVTRSTIRVSAVDEIPSAIQRLPHQESEWSGAA
ncbi:type II toxin-antitoxin system MqsA family antitoxin [Alloalcanivorax balearicus]|nr:type II toxin-antitoxin system MqsA family antitoxin [Alloalcanivorax balearicus]